jgi:two-component system, OmpR family, response regulator
MRDNYKIKLFLVDDDAVFLKLSQINFLDNADFDIETYATGELCVKNLDRNPDVIILDYLLNAVNENAMNGLDTLDKIKRYNSDIPVIILSAQDKIDVAVSCMQHRATDYVVKNETAFLRLKKIMTNIFSYRKMEKDLQWYATRA